MCWWLKGGLAGQGGLVVIGEGEVGVGVADVLVVVEGWAGWSGGLDVIGGGEVEVMSSRCGSG